MNLHDLSAADLATIDEICLEFEKRFRAGNAESIETVVQRFLRRHRGGVKPERIDLLRKELRAIEQELRAARKANVSRPAPPFQSQTRSRGAMPNAPNANSADTQWSGLTSKSAEPNDRADSPSIGPYLIGKVLARGGMGVVYRAVDTRLDRPVAIKMLGFPNLSADDPKRIELVERFEREAKAVAALSHPNIVELFDVGVADGVPYAVMEFLDGVTLADRFQQGPLSAEQTRQIGMQIAGALATAHAGGVIHRDLKPQNVMLIENSPSSGDSGLRIKLVDFGLSRLSHSTFFSAGKSDKTRLGTILGTPGYMAPEQARGEGATDAADVFGLGCVLYESFFGEQAIPGQTPADRLASTLTGEVIYLDDRYQQDPELCELIRQTLEKDSAKRPSAGDIYQRLRQASTSSAAPIRIGGGETDRISASGLRSRRYFLGLLGGGAAAAALAYWALQNRAVGAIDSVAVLTFRRQDVDIEPDGSGTPLDGRRITDGEALAAALVNELSALDGLAVRPFRPRMADSPEDFQSLGVELDVDALVTGTYRIENDGDKSFWVLNWELVSAGDGRVLEGDSFYSEKSSDRIVERLLDQTSMASAIARQLGRVLVANADKARPPNPDSYSCLVKGKAQADVDSTKGLRMALMCFDKARMEEPGAIEPIGAYAVTAINLAARIDREEADLRVSEAISSMREAIAAEPKQVDALLAQAIIEWQIFFSFEDALVRLGMLADDYQYNWQIQHQFGLLMATLGKNSEALQALRRASTLNPASVFIKVDRCRIDWFFGNTEQAIDAAIRYRDSLDRSDVSRAALARGLLVDIYEQQQRWDKAAAEQAWDEVPATRDRYFELRQEALVEHPYGPYGEVLNDAIYQLRSQASTAEELVGGLSESRSPMFPLLFNRHPAFLSMRNLYRDADEGSRPNYLVLGDAPAV